MRTIRNCLLSACLLLASPVLASGSLGIFAVIDRVVFEPNAEAPERVQVFGAFAYFAGQLGARSLYTDAVRGYLYFSLPARGDVATVRREWADLAAVAGTGEGVAFGSYFFSGSFDGVAVDVPTNRADSRNQNRSGNAVGLGEGVQAIGVAPTVPAEYHPGDLGVVQLGEGNYDEIVAELKALLDE